MANWAAGDRAGAGRVIAEMLGHFRDTTHPSLLPGVVKNAALVPADYDPELLIRMATRFRETLPQDARSLQHILRTRRPRHRILPGRADIRTPSASSKNRSRSSWGGAEAVGKA